MEQISTQQLFERERIKELKARYFRALDTKDWTLFGACLTEDVEGRYSDGQLSFDGREQLVGFMAENLSSGTLLTMHHGHHPEIEIAENNTQATGIWYLHDMVISLENRTRLYGAAIYRDEYRMEKGQWRISKTGYSRTFEFVEPLSEKHESLQNMFTSS